MIRILSLALVVITLLLMVGGLYQPCSEGFPGERIEVCAECGICDSSIATDSSTYC